MTERNISAPGKNMLFSALLLVLFAVAGTGLVALTHSATAERIAHNERETLLQSLHALISPDSHDNDIYSDRITVQDSALLGSKAPLPVYRARLGGKPVALVMTPVAPDGYSGDIRLLVAIRHDGTLAGVRVVAHKETPGLGDKIEVERSDWIHDFAGRSLDNPATAQWKVRKDGGVFDQFTGATITPRAVVKTVHNTLRYYQEHRDALFAPTQPEEHAHGG